uniref:Integrase zinc-binding domain-containing protein n=1 Tax=Quercus lobata TaxID=97700 RepID=A0A7N2L5B4_QUELO
MYNIQENVCIMFCTYCSSYNKCAAEWVAALQEHIGQDSHLKPMILNHVHGSPLAGHSSYLKSLHRAKQNFYWEDMKKDLNRQSTSAKSVIGSKLRPLLPLDYHSPCLFQLGLGQISAWISLMDYQSHRFAASSFTVGRCAAVCYFLCYPTVFTDLTVVY